SSWPTPASTRRPTPFETSKYVFVPDPVQTPGLRALRTIGSIMPFTRLSTRADDARRPAGGVEGPGPSRVYSPNSRYVHIRRSAGARAVLYQHRSSRVCARPAPRNRQRGALRALLAFSQVAAPAVSGRVPRQNHSDGRG